MASALYICIRILIPDARLSTTPGVILTARYFDRQRAKANAFCLSGTAAGSFILPHLIQAMVDEYGFRGAMLLLGGCMLHLCISAALYRPLAVHVVIAGSARRKRRSPGQGGAGQLRTNPSIVVLHHSHPRDLSPPTDAVDLDRSGGLRSPDLASFEDEALLSPSTAGAATDMPGAAGPASTFQSSISVTKSTSPRQVYAQQLGSAVGVCRSKIFGSNASSGSVKGDDAEATSVVGRRGRRHSWMYSLEDLTTVSPDLSLA
jgi:hypothetical protein